MKLLFQEQLNVFYQWLKRTGDHRREQDKKSLDSDISNKKEIIKNQHIAALSEFFGRIFGAIVIIIAILCALYIAVITRDPVLSGMFVAVPVIAGAIAVITGHTKNNKE